LALQTGNSQVLQTRIDAIETAQISFEARITRVPTEVDVKVDHLRGLMDEKFNSLGQQIVIRDQNINQRFDERDVRSDRESLDNKTAVNAAFAAAKEAVAEQNKSSALAISKSEASTTKQIDQIGVQIATTTKATDEKNSDLKDQIARLQVGPIARREGSDATRVSFQWAIATGVMGLAVLLTFLASHFH